MLFRDGDGGMGYLGESLTRRFAVWPKMYYFSIINLGPVRKNMKENQN
jgi:hypothetical protein